MAVDDCGQYNGSHLQNNAITEHLYGCEEKKTFSVYAVCCGTYMIMAIELIFKVYKLVTLLERQFNNLTTCTIPIESGGIA